MTKYSTPSIEVVNFSSSDAPRIGMQWWYGTNAIITTGLGENAVFAPAPAGFTPTPANLGSVNGPYTYTAAVNGLDCSSVSYYNCTPEGPNLPADAFAVNGALSLVLDDGKSC